MCDDYGKIKADFFYKNSGVHPIIKHGVSVERIQVIEGFGKALSVVIRSDRLVELGIVKKVDYDRTMSQLEKYGMGRFDVTLHIPLETGKDNNTLNVIREKEALENLGKVGSRYVLFGPGWQSISDLMMNEDIGEGRTGAVISQALAAKLGIPPVVLSLQLPGVKNEHGIGVESTNPNAPSDALSMLMSKLEVAFLMGMVPDFMVGHSLSGLSAEYLFQIMGIPSLALNPAGASGLDGNMFLRMRMRVLVLSSRFFPTLSNKLSNISNLTLGNILLGVRNLFRNKNLGTGIGQILDLDPSSATSLIQVIAGAVNPRYENLMVRARELFFEGFTHSDQARMATSMQALASGQGPNEPLPYGIGNTTLDVVGKLDFYTRESDYMIRMFHKFLIDMRRFAPDFGLDIEQITLLLKSPRDIEGAVKKYREFYHFDNEEMMEDSNKMSSHVKTNQWGLELDKLEETHPGLGKIMECFMEIMNKQIVHLDEYGHVNWLTCMGEIMIRVADRYNGKKLDQLDLALAEIIGLKKFEIFSCRTKAGSKCC